MFKYVLSSRVFTTFFAGLKSSLIVLLYHAKLSILDDSIVLMLMKLLKISGYSLRIFVS